MYFHDFKYPFMIQVFGCLLFWFGFWGCIFETGSRCVAQIALEFSILLFSLSNTGITGVHNYTWL
jgi:hypothetical protein